MKTKEKGFYKTFFSMYFVLVFQNVISLSVNLADNIMLGAYSENALSGVAAVNQIQFVYQQLLMAAGDGMVIFCSQYWGQNKTGPIKKIAAVSMHTALAIGAVLFLAVSLFPYKAVGLFTEDQAIIEEGVRYLAIIRFTYFFFAVTTILLATLRSVEIVRIAFYLSLTTLAINCCINYILIYGKFGAPRLGAEGAAIGTLAARITECVIAVIYVAKKEPHLHLRLKDYMTTNRMLAKDYFKVSLPMFLVQGLWGLNTALQTVILGHMTAGAIAANSAASNLFLMVKSTASGAASAASVMIGKAIGRGNMDVVTNYARRMQKIFVIIGICSGILLFFLRIPILSLYELAPETRQMADHFLIILSIVCVTMSYQMPTNNGIIRGGGSAMFVVKMDLISIWGIVIPLSLAMAFIIKASPEVVVCCLNADQVFKCLPAFFKVNCGKWVKKLTR